MYKGMGAEKLALRVFVPSYTVAPYKGGSKKVGTYNRNLKGSGWNEIVGFCSVLRVVNLITVSAVMDDEM
jgi:hypothetical protein